MTSACIRMSPASRILPTRSTSRPRAIAARATLRAALERRETRGAHNRSDYPDLDPDLQVNLVWSPDDTITRETIPPVPAEIQDLIVDVSTAGKLVE